MREGWEAGGCQPVQYYIKAYGYVFLMQGIFSLINASSLYYINIWSIKDDNTLFWTDYAGAAVWLLGFMIEVCSDRQLTVHLAKPRVPGQGKFIKTGLWRYSRHPNYFGEAVMWYGIAIMACSVTNGWITLYSAVFINLMLRYVSGVPFPEEKYKNNAEWQ